MLFAKVLSSRKRLWIPQLHNQYQLIKKLLPLKDMKLLAPSRHFESAYS